MRLLPFGRRAPRLPAPPDDLALIEDLLRRNVEDLVLVRDRQLLGGVVVFRGELTMEPARVLDILVERFRPFGYTPFLRPDRLGVAVQAWPLAQTAGPERIGVNLVLFALTCLSTLFAGALFFVGSPTFDAFRSGSLPLPLRFLAGVPFAAPLLAILVTHEFGHYFTARYYRASVSLPYFIPAPPPFLFGTLGAIIRMRSPARDRNALFDIAAAGPLAGLAVAIPAMLVGIAWSTPGPPAEHMMLLGDSLLRRFLVYLTMGELPSGFVLHTHPIADAAWAGFLVTALNLFPVGQLDGGRIAYAMFGRYHRALGIATVLALVALTALTWSFNWLVWALLIFFFVGFDHHPPLNDLTPLSLGRRIVGWTCLVLFVLLIPPIPFDGP